MLSLDEAITHCEEKSKAQRKMADYYIDTRQSDNDDYRIGMSNSCLECAQEHEQLAEWLKELKEWRQIGQACIDKGICVPIIAHEKIVPDNLQGWRYEE